MTERYGLGSVSRRLAQIAELAERAPEMVITTLACLPIFWTKGLITRLEGGILLGLYIFYVTDQVLPRTLPTWQDEFRLVVLCVVLPTVIVLIVTQAVVYWRQLRRNRP